jgi:hypothetical protein
MKFCPVPGCGVVIGEAEKLCAKHRIIARITPSMVIRQLIQNCTPKRLRWLGAYTIYRRNRRS